MSEPDDQRLSQHLPLGLNKGLENLQAWLASTGAPKVRDAPIIPPQGVGQVLPEPRPLSAAGDADLLIRPRSVWLGWRTQVPHSYLHKGESSHFILQGAKCHHRHTYSSSLADPSLSPQAGGGDRPV